MFKIVRILFFIAAILFVGKSFLGFNIFDRNRQHQEINVFLLQKLFSKRKQEYLEEDLIEVIAIQQQLSGPGRVVLTFTGFLALLFALSKCFLKLSNTVLEQISCILRHKEDTYLNTRQLII